VLLTPAEMTHVKSIPNWTEARDAVRKGPDAWRVKNLPDNSVGFLNEVKKHFDAAPKTPAPSSTRPAIIRRRTRSKRAPRPSRVSASSSPPTIRSRSRSAGEGAKKFLEPLLQGPLGKLAKKDVTTQKAIAALFPENPVPGTHNEVHDAVSALVQRRPAAAEQLVRAHAEMVFNRLRGIFRAGPTSSQAPSSPPSWLAGLSSART
jgi:hypothetical protein